MGGDFKLGVTCVTHNVLYALSVIDSLVYLQLLAVLKLPEGKNCNIRLE